MIKSIMDDYNNFMKMIDDKLPEDDNTSVASENYIRPMNVNQYRIQYGQRISDILLEDPAINFMANTGISIIKKENTLEEQKNAWTNWCLMSDEMKERSDQKSLELYRRTNRERYMDFCKYEFGYAVATEANGQQDPDDDGAKSDTQNVDKSEAMTSEEKGKAIGHMIMEIIDELFASIEDVFGKFISNTKLLIESDEGFIKKYASVKQKYKPSPVQDVIVYDYDSKKIDAVRREFISLVTESINDLSHVNMDTILPDNSIFEIDEGLFEKTVLKYLTAPEGVKNMKHFFDVMRNDFRGKKITKKVKPSDIPFYEKPALSKAKSLDGILTADKGSVYTRVSSIKSTLRLITHNKTLSDEVRNRVKKYIKRMIKLEKMFNSFLDLYYRLKTEEISSAREVLKRMYGEEYFR